VVILSGKDPAGTYMLVPISAAHAAKSKKLGIDWGKVVACILGSMGG